MRYFILISIFVIPFTSYAQAPILFGENLVGPGVKMMLVPSKAAFRAGELKTSGATYWDLDSIGVNSFASGLGTKASGPYSTAMGSGTKASGFYSTAKGNGTKASGTASTVMGTSYHSIRIRFYSHGKF